MLLENLELPRSLAAPPEKKHKILIVNARPNEGGASKAAHRLYRALEQAERYELGWMSSRSTPGIADSLYPRPDDGLASLASRQMRAFRRSASSLLFPRTRMAAETEFDFGTSLADDDVRSAIPACSLVNLHWVTGLIDPATVAWIAANRAPVVWTLHDMAPLTGGCHFDAGCGGFVDGCRHCPQLGGWTALGPTGRYQQEKLDRFGRIPDNLLHLVSPSRWLADEARRSPQFRDRPIHVIPNSIDLDAFQPRHRAKVRRELGIPDDSPVVLFVAENVTNRRKGADLLAPIVKRMREISPDVVVALAGSGIEAGRLGFDFVDLGEIGDDVRLSEIYSMADVTLVPSLQDNLPNVMAESMACGVPVAAFRVGGIPDLTVEGRTGALADAGDVGGLAEAVVRLLGDRDFRDRARGQCREMVSANCSPGRQSERYAEVFDGVIATDRSRVRIA